MRTAELLANKVQQFFQKYRKQNSLATMQGVIV